MAICKAPVAQLAHLRRVAALGVAHAGIDGVSGGRERARREMADTGRCAGDEDDGFHGSAFSVGRSSNLRVLRQATLVLAARCCSACAAQAAMAPRATAAAS